MKEKEIIEVGNTVSFNYKGGRFVKGLVISVSDNHIELTLQTDYMGKNVDWYAGEKKDFNRNECNNIKIFHQ